MSRRQFSLNTPIPAAWQDYVTELPIGLEIVPGQLWDQETYVSGTTTELLFFVNIQGKNQNLTNMDQPRILSNPEAFLVEALRIKYKSRPFSDDSGTGNNAAIGSQFDDIIRLSDFGVVNFKIGEKSYGPYLPWTFPVHSFVQGAFSTGSDVLADYGQVAGRIYPMEPNLMIAPLQKFQVTISWPAGALTLVDGNCPIVVFMDGKRSRAIQ